MPTILIIEDHTLMRQATAGFIATLVKDADITATSSIAEAKRASAEKGQPNFVLLDLGLPNYSGVTALAETMEAMPTARIVIMSGQERVEIMMLCKSMGAIGYIPKTLEPRKLEVALTSILVNEGGWFPAEVYTEEARRTEPLILTPRESTVLIELVRSQGGTKELARALQLEVSTVKTYLNRLLRKTGAKNRSQLIKFAIDRGLAN